MDNSTRHCPRCLRDVPLDDWGSQSYCKPCFAEYMQARRGAKPRGEVACSNCGKRFMQVRSNSKHCSVQCRDRERHRVKQATDPEYRLARAEYAKRYHVENREKHLESSRRWREQNRERHRELTRIWWAANKYRFPSWRVKNPAAHAARQRARMRRIAELTPYPIRHEDVVAKIEYWGGRCWVCGADYEAIDHVKPLAKGGLNIVANMRPICTFHNSKKGDRWFGPHRLAELVT